MERVARRAFGVGDWIAIVGFVGVVGSVVVIVVVVGGIGKGGGGDGGFGPTLLALVNTRHREVSE